jgi:hypothetical protein
MADRLGEVLGQVADVAAGFLGAAEDALDVHLCPEPDGVRGNREVGRVGGLVPGGQGCAGVGVDERLGAVAPPRQPVAGVPDFVVGGPPHLVVGGGDDGAQLGAGDGAADGGVEVRGAAALGFNGAEVLDLPADAAAGVLPEPVDEPCEVDRVAGGAAVVVAVSVQIPEKVLADKDYANARANNDADNAKLALQHALQKVMQGMLRDETQLFKQFVDNPDFRMWLTDAVFDSTYGKKSA